MEITPKAIVGIIAMLMCLPPTILVMIGCVRNYIMRRIISERPHASIIFPWLY